MPDMPTRRLRIVGASGAGVTTLGRALADALAVPPHDKDDYYWRPTAPLYREKRDVADREARRFGRDATSPAALFEVAYDTHLHSHAGRRHAANSRSGR
jgi:hypothetical protein